MIKEICKNKSLCCGCTACASACPVECIKMEEDNEGFIYPHINESRCVNCGLCEAVCPILHNPTSTDNELKGYVVRDKRYDILKNGTSGSVFTSIMEYVLKAQGVVYGVIVDSDNVVRHIRVEGLDDENFSKIPGSKYCRSDIQGIYKQIKADLDSERVVAFSGTPCQAAGLKTFLRKNYNNLYIVDLICRGTPSPKLWKKYLDYQENKYHCRVTSVRFRNKTYGYHSGTMKLVFENGKEYYGSARVNFYLKSFFKDLCSRPSCYACSFKRSHHPSDITLYDSWHAHDLCGVNDDDKGYTNVIVQSAKGANLLTELSHQLEIYEADVEKAIKLDGIMVRNSVCWNVGREKFFVGLDEEPLDKHCLKFYKVTLKDKLIEKAKKFVKRRLK